MMDSLPVSMSSCATHTSTLRRLQAAQQVYSRVQNLHSRISKAPPLASSLPCTQGGARGLSDLHTSGNQAHSAREQSAPHTVAFEQEGHLLQGEPCAQRA